MKARSLLTLSITLALVSASTAVAQRIPLQTVIDRMNQAAATYPAICQMVNLTQKYGTPQTWRGRDMFAVKISDNVAQEEDEESFMMVAAHHGNEYGTPYCALEAMDRLTQDYGTDPRITNLVNNREIWIAPVWNADGYPTSRHNRNPSSTVDLNRNYPFMWNTCNSGTRGVGPASEPETQTMVAWSEDQRFDKVIDFHSSGRETLYAYRIQGGCPQSPIANWLRSEAIAISTASSYNGDVRGPSSNGEHYQWQLGAYMNYAFLTEISSTQSPSTSSAQSEARRVWPGTLFMLERPIPVWGHVTDAVTGAPIQATISFPGINFTQGERNRSEPGFGRYHAFIPNGNRTIRFSHPCYQDQDIQVNVTSGGTQLEVQLMPSCAACIARNGSGINPTGFDCVTDPELGTNWDSTIATTASTMSTQLGLGAGPAQMPFLGGEVLIDLTVSLFVPGMGSHSVPIPNIGALLGAQLSSQGFRVDMVAGSPTLVMLNAQDLTIGISPGK